MKRSVSRQQPKCLDKTLATIQCIPDATNDGGGTGGNFDISSLNEVPCGISIKNLEHATIQDLPRLELLTSRPDLLNEVEIETASKIISSFRSNNTIAVSQVIYF